MKLKNVKRSDAITDKKHTETILHNQWTTSQRNKKLKFWVQYLCNIRYSSWYDGDYFVRPMQRNKHTYSDMFMFTRFLAVRTETRMITVMPFH